MKTMFQKYLFAQILSLHSHLLVEELRSILKHKYQQLDCPRVVTFENPESFVDLLRCHLCYLNLVERVDREK